MEDEASVGGTEEYWESSYYKCLPSIWLLGFSRFSHENHHVHITYYTVEKPSLTITRQENWSVITELIELLK